MPEQRDNPMPVRAPAHFVPIGRTGRDCALIRPGVVAFAVIDRD